MFCIIFLMTIFRFQSIDMDCGSPPLPHSTYALTVGNSSHFAQRYEEYSSVGYKCDSEDKKLVGDSTLRCFNGHWVGMTPKCAIPTKSFVKKLVISDFCHGKRSTTRFLKQSFDVCYKPGQKWNITSSQKILFEIETNSRIDYFSLVLFGPNLVQNWWLRKLILTAKIERPRKHCVLDKFELMEDNSNKTQITFKCFTLFGEISIHELNLSDKDSLQMFSLEIESKDRILVKYCSLKTFSFSDSCGLPERPLHSKEVVKEKSFIEFSCDDDFYLEPINGQKVICGSLGYWSRPFPKCLAKTYCPLPAMDAIDHYIHVEYKNLNYLNGTPFAEKNSIAIYSCRSGNRTDVQLIGDHIRVCNKGFWGGSQPKCLENYKISRKSTNLREFGEHREYSNVTNVEPSFKPNHNHWNWHKFNLIVISMLVSFLFGAAFLGFIVFLLMKYLSVWRSRRVSTTENMPSVVISEPNHYFERDTYQEYRYESLRMNALELLDLERINSLYQTSN